MIALITDDDRKESTLAATNAGNGTEQMQVLGQGGNRWSFCPHTVHNSYIIDIGLAEEVERAVAGPNIQARKFAFEKLRNRVREEAEPEAPNWSLSQSQTVHGTEISIYQRKRPRGDFKNLKMTGMVGEGPKEWIRGILSFEKRKQWESMFEDGVVVEAIDLDEPSMLDKSNDDDSDSEVEPVGKEKDKGDKVAKNMSTAGLSTNISATSGAEKLSPVTVPVVQQDEVLSFLQTVELAGIPAGMSIAFLNDTDRQHALAHLRKRMMLSSPHECMLCQTSFDTPADIRFCPCCAMVSCTNCVCKRVFEAVSRRVVSVCSHCYRESSRIRHPPSAVKNDSHISASLRGKWWRPEELNLIDYSSSISSSMNLNSGSALMSAHLSGAPAKESPEIPENVDRSGNSSKDASDNDSASGTLSSPPQSRASKVTTPRTTELIKEQEQGDGVGREVDEDDEVGLGAVANTSAAQAIKKQVTKEHYATCKKCGSVLPRDVDAIEAHMDTCNGAGSFREGSPLATAATASEATIGQSTAGVNGRGDINSSGTRIIYRTARQDNSLFNFRPREVCALQDSFTDSSGAAYVYEISVRHCDVQGTPGYVTADVLLQMHVARPVPGNKNASSITIVSQVDTRAKGPGQWFLSLVGEDDSGPIGVTRRNDLVRELEASGPLVNILKHSSGADEKDEDEGAQVSLDDFELLAVLGRGGFGKVMQLVRRRQVERTQTERTILAAVKHPFIVCLHYAFQNVNKLYMVMDFVQGGDFFTLMRKHRHWVRIYVGEIAMALQHLHDMDVVYRDLKPENILLCSDGHLKLTDFGLSRFFETHDIITRSFCGTEQYMSPEMLLQQGHNFRMDWWCLGLLMHEMISAKHPFHGPSHYDTLRNMVTKQPVIDSADELKSLPWFSGLDWEALYEKKIKMAYLPDLDGMEDVSSFETTFTREEAIDSITSDPLGGKSKKRGGLLGLFGLGGETEDKSAEIPDASDAFQDFGFVKDTEGLEQISPTAAKKDAATKSFSGEQGSAGTAKSDVAATQSNGDAFVPAAPIRKTRADEANK
eukprot:GSChrysophyteH1.ASY1.ANO1.572.1 assembled CDS